ncbi:MAG TPA: carboxypeptidase regulatory-like domain-containing protein [Verrucomicrobiae bacterium]|jgi:plastocyanin
MKTIICFLLLVAAAMQPMRAGTIVGTVHAQGKTDAQDETSGPYASRKYKFAERVHYEELRDFVVYIDGPMGTNAVVPPSQPAVITSTRVTQQGAMFSPHVLPVVVGTTVQWPNNDQIFHNVFSMSETTNFDLGLYKGNPKEKRITFNKAGRADVFCSIHANMHCIVLVLENPYFCLVDDHNHYSISNVPPGTYKLKAWHERMPPQTREITVPENGEVKADFVLGFDNLPKL